MKESTLSSEQILDAYINILNDYTVTGFRRTKQWAQDQYLYFYAEFSKPFTGYGICNNGMKKTATAMLKEMTYRRGLTSIPMTESL